MTETVCTHCASTVEELGHDGFYFRCPHCDTRHRMLDCRVCRTHLPASTPS